MTTYFKSGEQTTKKASPNGEPLPLVTPEAETLRQKSGPDNPFKLKIQNGGGRLG
jgi:hypothetical protein